MLIILAAAAAAPAASQPPRHHHRKKHHAALRYDAAPYAAVGGSPKDPGIVAERRLRRQTVRLARIAYFERREAMLTDYLTKTHTETPDFNDPAIEHAAPGIDVGPTAVTTDFLGSATIRTRVRNADAATTGVLITATLRASDGRTARASTVLMNLSPGESRTAELTCPERLTPVSLTWSAISL